MKAYTIHKKYVCQITGEVLAEVTMSQSGPLKSFLHPFTNIESANAYLEKEARDWFLICIENYVLHKEHIIKANPKTDPLIIKSLELCKNALVEYDKRTLENICKGFNKGFAHFKAILPSSQNPSFDSSASALNELSIFCANILKTPTV